jgi:hypothetical protein
MTARTFDDLQKRIDDWTYDMLNDDDKMQAWVEERNTLNELLSLDASGLLEEEQRKRIITKVKKKQALDELFGVE